MLCAECGHRIRFEVKEYNGYFYDSRCHRATITLVYEFLTDAISANWLMYRFFSGEKRISFRNKLRELIAEYRTLSY